MKKISIIVPSFNEEKNIEVLLSALHKVMEQSVYDYEIIFVDDGSKDNSLCLLQKLSEKDSKLFYVELSRNFGHQNALMAGLKLASGDCYITMDGDMQHPPELLPEMITKWEEGYDVIYTRRLDDRKTPAFKRWTSKYFYKLLNYISEVEIEKGTADFRLMDKKVAKVFFAFTEKEIFLRGLVSWVGFRQYAIDYVPHERHSGKSKYTMKMMMQLAIKAVTSFSIRPLYLSIFIGFSITLFAFLFYVSYVVYSLYFGASVSGWASIIFTVVFFGGLNLFVLGIVGIYVGKLFMESKNRPNYIVRDTNLNKDNDTIKF